MLDTWEGGWDIHVGHLGGKLGWSMLGTWAGGREAGIVAPHENPPPKCPT